MLENYAIYGQRFHQDIAGSISFTANIDPSGSRADSLSEYR